MKFAKLDHCICGLPECFLLQNDVCNLTASPTVTDSAAFLRDNPWCQPTPFRVYFNPKDANCKTWLWLLSFHRHIPTFREKFVSLLRESTTTSTSGSSTTTTLTVNRIHFPHALLQCRADYGAGRNTSLMLEAAAKRIAGLDYANRDRMIEFPQAPR